MTKQERFKKLFDETAEKILLPWWVATFQLNSSYTSDWASASAIMEWEYRTITVHYKDNIDYLLDKCIFSIRLLTIHELVHTYFNITNDALEDLTNEISRNVMTRTQNRILYLEEQNVEALARKLYKVYRPKEYNKYCKEYWMV